MNVRPASFRDLASIEQLHREAELSDESQGVVPSLAGQDSPVPQTALVRVWYAVSKTLTSLLPTADADALLVAEDSGSEIVGFIQAQAVAGQSRTWHILNLCVAPGGRGHFAGEPLVTQLVNLGMERGVHRFSVRVPVDHPRLALFLDQGFTQYATEQILFRDDAQPTPRVLPGADADGVLRPARREDIGAIHLLYLRTTPSHVADLEGPSLKAWQAAFHQGWLGRMGRDDTRHLVAERPGVVAWAAVRAASPTRPALLGLMVDGQDAQLREEVVDAALAQVPPGPLSCVLRHYDSELVRSLQRRSFQIYGSQLVLVRDLAVRVRMRSRVRRGKEKARLAPAGLMQGMRAHRPLAVPVNSAERSQRSSPR